MSDDVAKAEYRGAVIAEGLAEPEAVNKYDIERVFVTKPFMPIDGKLGRAHIYFINCDDEGVEKLRPHVRDGWYIHFWNEDVIKVVFNDRTFDLPRRRDSSWGKAVQHGLGQGIPREGLDFPTERAPFLRIMQRPVISRHRTMTSSLRALPDFLIIGAQRAGTTSLYNYVIRHPRVAPAFRKEVHFFDENHSNGEGWYRAHFPPRSIKRLKGYVTGESSPYYMYHPLAAKRVKALLPDVKLMAILRDPVDRAISNYYHQVRKGWELLPMDEAFDREEARIKGEAGRIADDSSYISIDHKHYSYVTRGIYADQLKVWFDLFPRKNILVLKNEDFSADPGKGMKRVLRFLGLPGHDFGEFRRYNVSHYPEIDDALRSRLNEFYEPHNKRLYDLIGEDFGW